MQEYRSGHNEAVLKTVRPKVTGVRIPLPAPNKNGSTQYECYLFYFPINETEGFERVGSEYSPGDCRANPDRVRRRERIPLPLTQVREDSNPGVKKLFGEQL